MALPLGLLCLLGISAAHARENADAPARPNIVVILADDLGYGDIGCFGSKKFRTPNIDSIAARGMRFTDFHSNGAVCSPTRAALLTGRYQQRCGITGVVTAARHRAKGMPVAETTFAEVMAAGGYDTAMFGKWHLGYKPKFNPVHQGFGEFRGYVSGNVDYHAHIDQEGYRDWWRNDKLEPDTGYSTDLITAYAVDFLKRHKKSNARKPFLLYIAHEAPHYPYQGRNDPPQRSANGKAKAKRDPKQSARAYKEMIEVMDEGVGLVLKTLKALGQEQNTLVIFFSDNGPARFGSAGPLRGKKGQIFEGGHRIPAAMRWPGVIRPGSVCRQTCAGFDIFPTIAALAGAGNRIPAKQKLDGIDLTPALAGKPLPPRPLFWGVRNEIAIRKGPWKLIASKPAPLPFAKPKNPRLYNLDDDLGETKNLAAEHPELVRALLKELAAWNDEVNRGVEKQS
jgi:arylsulfatase A-like enzyme